MIYRRLLIYVLGFLSLCGLARASEKARYLTGPEPTWVERVTVPQRDTGDFGKSSASMHYLLVDEQAEAGQATSYFHYAYEVLAESGLEEASEISVTFDPSYEKLTFHHIRRCRKGEWKELLPKAKIEILHREKEMEYQLLDGSLTAVCHLEDIRTGDIIEHSYSRQGAHPLMSGRFCDFNRLTWATPVQELKIRVVAPKKQAISSRLYLDSGEVQVEEQGENKVYHLHRQNISAVLSEDGVPSSHDEYAWVQWSDFQNWKEVVIWALPLYPMVEHFSPDLQAEVNDIAAQTQDKELRILKALQWVQSQIRYLGLEMGAGSHRPNAPDLVLSRRFGDCKDKTLLLVNMLKALGVEAYPALVDTEDCQSVEKRLPSPYCFNHVITQVILPDGETLWLDPTRRVQYGKLKALTVGDYRKALVIRQGNDKLTSFTPRPESLPKMEVKETFKVEKPGERSLFQVRTTYTGQLAESNRNHFAENSRAESQKNCLDYYGKIYPGIHAKKEIRIEDDREANVLEVWEDYEIEDLWQKEKNGGWSIEFYPHEIDSRLTETGKLDRKAPLELIYPTDVVSTTVVEMFEPWDLEVGTFTQKSEFLSYTRQASVDKKWVTFRYAYQTLKDEVPASQIKAYHKALSEVKGSMGYTLTYDPDADSVGIPDFWGEINWLMVILTVLVIAVSLSVAGVLWFMTVRATPLPPTTEVLDGLEGWLILVGAGIICSPFVLGFRFLRDFSWIYQTEYWNVLTMPGRVDHQTLLIPVLLIELVMDLLLLSCSVWLIPLFFSRRALFPKVVMGVLLSIPLTYGLDYFLAIKIPGLTEFVSVKGFGKEVGFYVLQALVWIPYFIVSKRVRAVFRF
jgi:hypothetical protein